MQQRRAFIAGYNLKQSQSVESIVGFVLEWVARNVMTREDGTTGEQSIFTDDILDMKADIIKGVKK